MTTKTITIDAHCIVPVASAEGGKVAINLSHWTDEDWQHVILHGLKQLLGDAAAGKSGTDATTAIAAKAERLVKEGFRMGQRGASADPIEVEMRAIGVAALRKIGMGLKPAREAVAECGPVACMIAAQRHGAKTDAGLIRQCVDEVNDAKEKVLRDHAAGIVESRTLTIKL